MVIELRRPRDVRTRIAASSAAVDAGRIRVVPAAIGVVARGLLLGVGIGIVAFGDRGGSGAIGSLAVVGILAIGAALLSWDR